MNDEVFSNIYFKYILIKILFLIKKITKNIFSASADISFQRKRTRKNSGILNDEIKSLNQESF